MDFRRLSFGLGLFDFVVDKYLHPNYTGCTPCLVHPWAWIIDTRPFRYETSLPNSCRASACVKRHLESLLKAFEMHSKAFRRPPQGFEKALDRRLKCLWKAVEMPLKGLLKAFKMPSKGLYNAFTRLLEGLQKAFKKPLKRYLKLKMNVSQQCLAWREWTCRGSFCSILLPPLPTVFRTSDLSITIKTPSKGLYKALKIHPTGVLNSFGRHLTVLSKAS